MAATSTAGCRAKRSANCSKHEQRPLVVRVSAGPWPARVRTNPAPVLDGSGGVHLYWRGGHSAKSGTAERLGYVYSSDALCVECYGGMAQLEPATLYARFCLRVVEGSTPPV